MEAIYLNEMNSAKLSDTTVSCSQSMDYWQQTLATDLPILELPLDYPRPPVLSFLRDSESIELEPALTQSIKQFGYQENVSVFETLLAAFQIFLQRYTAQDDIIVGAVSTSRLQKHDTVTLFNPVALRMSWDSEFDVTALLKRVTQTVQAVAEHKDYSFELLVEAFNPRGELNRAPIFQMMLVLCELPTLLLESPISEWELGEIQEYSSQCDLVAITTEEEDILRITFEYNAELFERSTIERMLGNFQMLLSGMVSDSQQLVSRLPLLSESERHQLLVEWNNTTVDYPQDKCIHQLFEEQVEKTPNAVAVIFEGEELTYQELNSQANQLAHYLQKLGIKPESLVGIYIERSLEMIVGLLGILKAGGAYIPIDPTYPTERISYLLEDSRVPVLLTQNHLKVTLPDEYSGYIIGLDSNWESIATEPKKNPVSGATPENLIYVIYTSGSTGKPKGTLNTHKGVVNRILWMQDEYQLTPSSRVLQKTPFSFDVSGWEFWWTLIMGARLVVAKPEGHKDPCYLIKLITEQEITTLHFVPSMLQLFLEEPHVESCSSLKQVFCSGEALPISVQQQFFARLPAELHNLYGPTEAAIDVTYWPCQPDTQLSSVPIGRPVANTQTYILDSCLQPVPIGVPGELYLGGVQLARGYLHRPELTVERFIENPFIKDFQSPRLYKTGDLACYFPDGNIKYLGRNDNQIKIRGFRIELGEIENVLEKHFQVEQAVVMAWEDTPGDKRLVAYLVSGQSQPSLNELREFLKNQLPDYMVPSAFVFLESLPLTPNGKVDRRALPEPKIERSQLESTYIQPESDFEKTIAQAWQEVLKIERVGTKDNFFDLGGHSILLGQVNSRLSQQLKQNLSIIDLFQYPTIQALANYLKKQNFQATIETVSNQTEMRRTGKAGRKERKQRRNKSYLTT